MTFKQPFPPSLTPHEDDGYYAVYIQPLIEGYQTGLVPATGIWFDYESMQYISASAQPQKNSYEKAHVLRSLIQIHPKSDVETRLPENFVTWFCSMLEVFFVRQNEYTVIPFPFRLIRIWLESKTSKN